MDDLRKRTWAEISLGNLRHNYEAIRARLPEGCRFLGVVKADAYGHGAVQTAHLLQDAGADYLAVSCLDEAMELRQSGVYLPILILGHTSAEFTETLIVNDLTQAVTCLAKAEEYSREAARLGKTLRVHIKLDTGMSRLGFLCADGRFDEGVAHVIRSCTLPGLEAEGVSYGQEGQSQIITTPNGIKVGIYCDYHGYYPVTEDCVAAIEQLKEDGAEYIICMFHWGQDEVVYHPKQVQIDLAHACVDAGADFVYGSHSHCLQPYEEYNGAYILYSIGNWSFGGNTSPKDMDTAIFQITVKRDLDGSISNESCGIIPCCVSSRPALEGYMDYGYNDYCPTPYEVGSELYERAMSKILGTYEGPDGVVDYSGWNNSYGG